MDRVCRGFRSINQQIFWKLSLCILDNVQLFNWFISLFIFSMSYFLTDLCLHCPISFPFFFSSPFSFHPVPCGLISLFLFSFYFSFSLLILLFSKKFIFFRVYRYVKFTFLFLGARPRAKTFFFFFFSLFLSFCLSFFPFKKVPLFRLTWNRLKYHLHALSWRLMNLTERRIKHSKRTSEILISFCLID
jgi:hypothetical protein